MSIRKTVSVSQSIPFFARIMAVLITLSLVLTSVPINLASAKKKGLAVSSVKLPFYYQSAAPSDKCKVYFKNGGDIPYIALEEWAMYIVASNNGVDKAFDISCKIKGNTFSYVRETGYDAKFDFKKKTLFFTDRNAFFRKNNMSLTGAETILPEVMPLFKRSDNSYNRYGSSVKIPLKKYGIDIFAKGGKHFIPLQTFSDVFVSQGCGGYFLYNGEAVFAGVGSGIRADMKKEFLSGKKKKRSKAYASFNYGEICMAFDYLYGLKSIHGIKSFDSFFLDTGLKQYLNNRDATMVDYGLYVMINYFLDDLHSGYTCYSYNSDYNGDYEAVSSLFSIPEGVSTASFSKKKYLLAKAYSERYPNEAKYYEEVDDTAYIKIDSFVSTLADYKSEVTEDELSDTIRLMQYSCGKILREKSPIKRVVLDLSLNSGGTVAAALFVIGAFLGESMFSTKDVITGAISNTIYNIDVNNDGKYDSKDTLAGKGLKLYCITSPVSFSCGNLVPCVFKESGNVTLIGRPTGGGSCVVQPLSTASGSLIRISGSTQISFAKNGSFYDVDRGTEPDLYIKDIEMLYDREYTNTVLDSIR